MRSRSSKLKLLFVIERYSALIRFNLVTSLLPVSNGVAYGLVIVLVPSVYLIGITLPDQITVVVPTHDNMIHLAPSPLVLHLL